MQSAVAKGQYWKVRTKKYLESRGYQVAYLERVMWIMTNNGRVPVKRDQFGADLLAVNQIEVVFVQVKGGETGRKNVAAARTEFAKYVFPPGTQQWIVVWDKRARHPEVIVAGTGPTGAIAASLAPPPKQRRLRMMSGPLFGEGR